MPKICPDCGRAMLWSYDNSWRCVSCGHLIFDKELRPVETPERERLRDAVIEVARSHASEWSCPNSESVDPATGSHFCDICGGHQFATEEMRELHDAVAALDAFEKEQHG